MSDIAELSITEAGKKLAAREISAVDLARACLANIDAKNKSLNAYLEVFEDVEAQAQAADKRRAEGESGPLLGIPLAMKDNILIEGRIASAASKMLEHYTAAYDATVTKKLKSAGAVFLGRTNMDEFALGGSTEHSAFGPTKNPYDETRVAGGTSGGSAAAVKAGMALGALGTDTGGSIRNPASFCGVVGLKPSYGAVSRSGLIAAVSSFDQAGPLARTVEDAECIFNVIRGKDVFDSTSQEFNAEPRAVRTVGVPAMLWGGALDPEVAELFSQALERLRAQNLEVHDDADTSHMLNLGDTALASYYIINFAEVSTNLARFDGVRYGLSLKGNSLWEDYATTRSEGFGEETRRRIMLGTYVLSAGYYGAYYSKAVAARKAITARLSETFEEFDIIATPTMPTPAPKLGEYQDALSMYLADICTVLANLTGTPAISVPIGMTKAGLPVGIQFMAPRGGENMLFSIGKRMLGEA